ncbi:MAG: DUF72 domain-containing protein [Armatimonadetes bacterium]|nr:DUF72 domain-containing protein [Armatimonadota bacterium]MDW8152911.1 DUF72 domain-containing protein [Armatimonadota bacterium]
MATAWIGTSGFTYRHWVGVLYPEDLPPRRWLRHYAEHFNAVELNVTFYRLPPRRTFEAWAQEVPDHFRFVLKGSRFITHLRRLREAGEALHRFFSAAQPLRWRLSCVLWQLPPRFRADPELLETFLQALPGQVRHAFEFRDPSWFTEAVYRRLEAQDAAVVGADWPFQVLLPDMTPQPLDRPVVRVPQVACWSYLRRHGPGPLYRSCYPEAFIRQDAAWIQEELRKGRDVYAFYNNDVAGYAVRNALSLSQWVRAEVSAP